MSEKTPAIHAFLNGKLTDPGATQRPKGCLRDLFTTCRLNLSRSADHPDKRLKALEHRIAALEVQTRRDATTGLYNREHLKRELELEFARALHEQLPLSLVFIDLDRFKTVNDTFGHAVGDQVLITMARRMLSAARQTDIVARYGGEEFVMLLPDTGASDALLISERILADVQGTPCLTRGGVSVTITFSAGIAALMPDSTAFSSPVAMLEAADQALYKAKNAGRACITMHNASA
jgi:diguanylate cyclase (GGDEF)-like protein